MFEMASSFLMDFFMSKFFWPTVGYFFFVYVIGGLAGDAIKAIVKNFARYLWKIFRNFVVRQYRRYSGKDQRYCN